jgi:hypothetical protein
MVPWTVFAQVSCDSNSTCGSNKAFSSSSKLFWSMDIKSLLRAAHFRRLKVLFFRHNTTYKVSTKEREEQNEKAPDWNYTRLQHNQNAV